MSEQINATCSICGNGYHLCLACKDAMKLQPWKVYTDTATCYQVFQVVKGYNTGVYNKEEFKSKLKNIDLSNLENYRDHIKSLIKDTLKEDKKEELIVNEVEKIVPSSRKRNYKIEETKVNENVEIE